MLNYARVRRGVYIDSITLMQVAHALQALEGVEKAAVVMATPTNLQSLATLDLAPFTGVTGNLRDNDTLIVVQARTMAYAEAALEIAETYLSGKAAGATIPATSGEHYELQPRSVEQAVSAHPQAGIAVISVPGMYAALEAQQALSAGLHVFLFSDNVSLEDECRLKRLAVARDLLMMGPDCGTALFNRVGLGFVNVVPDGPIGLVGASGTGMQQVMCLLAEAGYGISQAIGCGGRDLSAEVGGMTTLQGLRMLQEDIQTQIIVLISKPPSPPVARKVLATAAHGTKPVVVVFPGADPTIWQSEYGDHIYPASTLTEAAQLARALCESQTIQIQLPTTFHTREEDVLAERKAQTGQSENASHVIQRVSEKEKIHSSYLAALFSGGTLCTEALHIWGEQLGPVYSNIPIKPSWRWRAGHKQGHYALDLGADEYTLGRPHPMIDPLTRLRYLQEALHQPDIGVILLDIILGYCAQRDPAGVYAPLIAESCQQAQAAGRSLRYIISLCGTEDDPQQLSRQQACLRAVGAEVYTSNAVAALRCMEVITGHRQV